MYAFSNINTNFGNVENNNKKRLWAKKEKKEMLSQFNCSSNYKRKRHKHRLIKQWPRFFLWICVWSVYCTVGLYIYIYWSWQMCTCVRMLVISKMLAANSWNNFAFKTIGETQKGFRHNLSKHHRQHAFMVVAWIAFFSLFLVLVFLFFLAVCAYDLAFKFPISLLSLATAKNLRFYFRKK